MVAAAIFKPRRDIFLWRNDRRDLSLHRLIQLYGRREADLIPAPENGLMMQALHGLSGRR